MLRYFFTVVISLWLSLSATYAQSPGCSIGKAQLANALGAPELAKWMTLEASTCEAVEVSSAGVTLKLGASSLPVYGGNRSEVAVNFPFSEGDTVTYSWDMKLPLDFVGDPRGLWWLLAQWHDQPDRRLGETWAGFPPNAPPVALFVEQRGGVPGLGVLYQGNDKRSWAQVPLDVWLKVVLSIRWSTKDDGELFLNISDIPEFKIRISGRNMNNSYQHYLKVGQYRNKQSRLESSVSFRNLKIQKK